jgi:hypothetical protein
MNPVCGGAHQTLNRRIKRSFAKVENHAAEIVDGRDFLAGQLSIVDAFHRKKRQEALSATLLSGDGYFGRAGRSLDATSVGGGNSAKATRSMFTSGSHGHSSCPTLPPLQRKPAAISSCSWLPMSSRGCTHSHSSFGLGSFTFTTELVEKLYDHVQHGMDLQAHLSFGDRAQDTGSVQDVAEDESQIVGGRSDQVPATVAKAETIHQQMNRLEGVAEKISEEVRDRRTLLDWYKDQLAAAAPAKGALRKTYSK